MPRILGILTILEEKLTEYERNDNQTAGGTQLLLLDYNISDNRFYLRHVHLLLKIADNDIAVWLWGVAVAVLFLSALCYMPLSISLDNESLNINRSLKIKSIPLTEIANVKLCAPTMGAKRICGSGGWFGWYGWFSEKDLGKYFAYYGKASDCFLVTLKNGKKYMLGCKDTPKMVNAINEIINQ